MRLTTSAVPPHSKKFAIEWREPYPGGQVTLDEVVAEGDRVLVLWTFSGTQRGAKFIWIDCHDLTAI
jgi:predicted ester cyclase